MEEAPKKKKHFLLESEAVEEGTLSTLTKGIESRG